MTFQPIGDIAERVVAKVAHRKATREEILAVVDYDPQSGRFVWKRREETTRHVKTWNTRYAGQTAGAIDGHRRYLILSIGGKTLYAHRVAWFLVHGEWPPEHIDHRNGDGLSNAIGNLRLASYSQNLANQRISSANTSGFKGVGFFKRDGNWRAKIKVKGRTLHIGYFASREEAHAAYVAAAREHFGEFARAA